jgi:23S rRNA pseudouridine1911/1915/1917 synthase
LDKETTGLMVVAKNDRAHRHLAGQIKSKSAERVYAAVVFGSFDLSRFTIDAPIGRHPGVPSLMTVKQGGREAVTHVKVVRTAGAGTLVACRLETGRTHQIRVHLSSVGHPVKGDKQYAKKPWNEGPMQLHATLLSFDHPTTGARVTVYAEPPSDFEMSFERSEVEDWR